jgi:outer membrane lipoprotein-sorting protein
MLEGMMRRPFLTVCLAVLPVLAWAQADARELLQKVDALVSFLDSDFSAEYIFAESRQSEGVDYTQAAIFRRDAQNKYLILILSPEADKGKGYLKIGDNLWFYDPVPRKYVFTSSRDRFRNSNARNSDFTRSSFAVDYDVVATRTEMLGRFDCTVLDLKANNAEVTFPFTKIWISDDSLVRKTEDYSLSGQLLRIVMIPTYQAVGGRYVPQTILIVDELKGKTVGEKFVGDRTQITISKPSLARLPDNLFTRAYLEKVSR